MSHLASGFFMHINTFFFLPGVQKLSITTVVTVLNKMHFLFQACAKSKENRKWQQETGIFKVCRPRRSHFHQTISIGFDSEPNSCFELWAS